MHNIPKLRAQGTTEYLLIIAVVVVISLVVIGVLMNQTSSINTTSASASKLKSYSGEFAVKDFVVGEDGNAIIVLQNNSGGVVNIQSIGIGNANRGTGGTQLTSASERTFSLSDISSACDCSASIGQKKTCDLNISYTSAEGLAKNISLSVQVECETTVSAAGATFEAGECLTNSDCTSGQTCVYGANTSLNKCYSGVAGYWRFEGNANDFSPNGYTGTNNNAAYVFGKIGQGISVDGLTKSVTASIDSSTIGVNEGLTFSIWIYDNQIKSWADLIGWDGCSLHLYSGLGVLSVAMTYSFNSGIGHEAGVWEHLVGTRNATGDVIFYKNGTQVGSGNDALCTFESTTLKIGLPYDTSWGLNGLIDEPIIFNRVLSASEVAALYNAQRGS